MPLQPHEQRVIDEKEELDVKIEKLDAFTRTERFAGLSVEGRRDMRHQLHHMTQYSQYLGRRINLFKES